jgi:ribosomal protein L37AE/L43A
MVKRNERDSPDCPRCGEEEDATHVWSCKNEEAIGRWQGAVELLRQDLRKNQTQSAVTDAICFSLIA